MLASWWEYVKGGSETQKVKKVKKGKQKDTAETSVSSQKSDQESSFDEYVF